MTRRDYVLIAETLAGCKPVSSSSPAMLTLATLTWQQGCYAFANRLASENPRFDRARFLKACGVES